MDEISSQKFKEFLRKYGWLFFFFFFLKKKLEKKKKKSFRKDKQFKAKFTNLIMCVCLGSRVDFRTVPQSALRFFLLENTHSMRYIALGKGGLTDVVEELLSSHKRIMTQL